jgi:3-hydroxyacyl-CoA dehydrogenase
MFVFKAAVVGAGTMGGEIAHAVASAGIPVVLKDISQDLLDRGLERARALSSERDERELAPISGTTGYEDFGDVEFVIEAVPERIELKQAVFAELDEVTPSHAILSSNTSSLSITEMGEATGRPGKVVGFHFFYPASVTRLIEVVEGDDTSPETVQAAMNFAQRIRKTPIRCLEAPGFVVNRILTAAVSELWQMQEREGIEIGEIDRIIAESKSAPIGPFALADRLGLDTVLHVAEHLRASYGGRFHVHAEMRELVAAGRLGTKTGKGFYGYGD